VILTRWATSESLKQASSIISLRSQCPYCKTTLQARDLVPLLSFIFQGGKCRYCKKKISWFYPILELGSALIF
jgi:prepilin signal peptidase PulO-like enzyme (type II secretory pathway)